VRRLRKFFRTSTPLMLLLGLLFLALTHRGRACTVLSMCLTTATVPPSRPPATEQKVTNSDLALATADIIAKLRERDPAHVPGLPAEMHEIPTMMPRPEWQQLAKLIAERETPSVLDTSKWASLRLDGVNWGRLMHRLRQAGVIEDGFSSEIGEAMCACCRAVLDEFKGIVAYTHSDEMTIILAPSKQRATVPYNGRWQKWISIAASVATGLFNRKLKKVADAKGVALEEDMVGLFDCRIGNFDSELEASALLLWRAYDCGVNAAQDACHHNGAPPECVGSSFIQKMQWLQSAGLLPLHAHQAYGSLFAKSLGEFEGYDPEVGNVTVKRRINVLLNDGASGTPRNLLNFARNGFDMIPQLDDLRMKMREGSYWRYAGASGSFQSNTHHDPRNRPGYKRRRGRRPK